MLFSSVYWSFYICCYASDSTARCFMLFAVPDHFGFITFIRSPYLDVKNFTVCFILSNWQQWKFISSIVEVFGYLFAVSCDNKYIIPWFKYCTLVYTDIPHCFTLLLPLPTTLVHIMHVYAACMCDSLSYDPNVHDITYFMAGCNRCNRKGLGLAWFWCVFVLS